MTQGHSHTRFPATRWSWVEAAGALDSPDSEAALADLCRAYWFPIYALIRKRGYAPEDASDLVQEYFSRLLEGGVLKAADRTKGRFRAFLRTDCTFFLADMGDRRRAIKRGGGLKWFSLEDAEGRFLGRSGDQDDPAKVFDRAWALALLERTFARLSAEEVAAGRGEVFDRLRHTLSGGGGETPYAAIAEAMETTVTAVQATVVRLRRRYRTALRAEVAATLDAPDEAQIDEEVRFLIASLAR